jgi:LmbE family N-acetylglucosaminyl deacetylase
VTPRREEDDDDRLRTGPSGLPVGDLLTSEPITAELPTPRIALAVGAHPDDIEFGCGAALARWAAGGAELHYVVLTDGSKGTWDAGADLAELVAARVDECRAAAAVVDGADHSRPLPSDRIFFLQRVDGELDNGHGERRALARIIRQVRPTVVLGHDPWRRYRLHPDHRAAGHITVDALVAARDHHFFPELGLAPHRPESLLLWEADAPNHVEDARGFEQAKIDALLCHRSQLEPTMGIADDGTGEHAVTPAPGSTSLRPGCDASWPNTAHSTMCPRRRPSGSSPTSEHSVHRRGPADPHRWI